MESRSYYKRIVVSNKEKIWIGDIIRELVHVYGNEPYNNILINDIE
nr:MAG TPA: Transcription-silencing protein Clr2 [Caudoviricetes sp.]